MRAVGADRLALALLDAQHVDHRAAEQEHEHQRGDDGAAGAEGDVAEDVEEREVPGEIGQPIEHRFKPYRCLCSSAPASRKLAFQRLDDRSHFRAQRALHHHHVAVVDGIEHGRLQRRRGLGIAAPAVGGKGLPQRTHQGPRAEHQVDVGLLQRAGERRGAIRRRRGPAPACRRARRCGGRAGRAGAWPSSAMAARHRGRIGVVALVDQQRAAARHAQASRARRGRAPA